MRAHVDPDLRPAHRDAAEQRRALVRADGGGPDAEDRAAGRRPPRRHPGPSARCRGRGRGASELLDMACSNQPLGASTFCSPSDLAAPRAAPRVPSVTMKGGRASPAIRPPLTAPTAAPAATPASAATAAEPVAFMVRAVTTDAKAIAEPTEIDAAGADHEGHAEGADADDDRLQPDRSRCRPRRSPTERRRRRGPRRRRARGRGRSGRSRRARRPSRCHPWRTSAGVAPLAAAMRDSSSQAAVGRVSARRPRCITATRSQTRRSSGT